QQVCYTVERMDAAALPDDGDERPTVASPLSGPSTISAPLAAPSEQLALLPQIVAARGTPTGYVLPTPHRSPWLDGRRWAVISPLVAAAVVVGVMLVRRNPADPDPPTAPAAEARALYARNRSAAPPVCAPASAEPAASSESRLVELTPVTLASGE